MQRTKIIANRLREVILNGTWIANTNFKDQLSGLTWQQATAKVGTLNTIAALTYHINYYIEGVLNFFRNGKLEIRDKYSFDIPPVTSQQDWDKLRSNLWENAEKFAQAIERMADKNLDEVFVDEKYGNYQRNIDGIIEHGYYHLGQIVLIKKMLLESINIDSC